MFTDSRKKKPKSPLATLRLTHLQVFVHQSVGVHGLQIPVLVPLRKLGFVFHALPSASSFLHLPARPPVLQQTGNVEMTSLSSRGNYSGKRSVSQAPPIENSIHMQTNSIPILGTYGVFQRSVDTHGYPSSMKLFQICLKNMMTPICRHRSIKQPLG